MRNISKFLIALSIFLFFSINSFTQEKNNEIYNNTNISKDVVDELISESVLVKIPTLEMQSTVGNICVKYPEVDVDNKNDRAYNSAGSNYMIDKIHHLDLKDGLALKGKQSVFADDLSFILLSSKGTDLYIDYGANIAQQYNLPPLQDAYCLTVNDAGVAIVGYSEGATRKGIDTFKQILYSSDVKGSQFPYVRILSY